jgi:hypothetical protein
MKKKIEEVDKLIKQKDLLIDNIVSSMLEKFRKLEERLFTLENANEQNDNEITFCNPSTVEKECEEYDFITENPDDLEKHKGNSHENLSEIETIETESGQSLDETYKCNIFKTAHNPGLKSHMTKMHGQKVQHSCDQYSEMFHTRKKLKSHIYCIHSGKYKTLAQLIDEANP